MSLKIQTPRYDVTRFVLALLAIAVLFASCATLYAQSTISTGSIQGTVTDPTGAVVGGAKVTITNKGTGQVITVTTTSAGAYTSGALNPAEYAVRVEAKGFKTTQLGTVVQTNTTASGNVTLALGDSTQVIEVQAGEVSVNTEQAIVQGVLTSEQIENLPINGRNFLDLAQLEPGVQIQDGGTFDPTKNGFSSVSSVDASAAPPVSNLTVLTSAMRPSAPRPPTCPWMLFRKLHCNSLLWIFPPN